MPEEYKIAVRVACPKCGKAFNVKPDNPILQQPKVRCSKCRGVFSPLLSGSETSGDVADLPGGRGAKTAAQAPRQAQSEKTPESKPRGGKPDKDSGKTNEDTLGIMNDPSGSGAGKFEYGGSIDTGVVAVGTKRFEFSSMPGEDHQFEATDSQPSPKPNRYLGERDMELNLDRQDDPPGGEAYETDGSRGAIPATRTVPISLEFVSPANLGDSTGHLPTIPKEDLDRNRTAKSKQKNTSAPAKEARSSNPPPQYDEPVSGAREMELSPPRDDVFRPPSDSDSDDDYGDETDQAQDEERKAEKDQAAKAEPKWDPKAARVEIPDKFRKLRVIKPLDEERKKLDLALSSPEEAEEEIGGQIRVGPLTKVRRPGAEDPKLFKNLVNAGRVILLGATVFLLLVGILMVVKGDQFFIYDLTPRGFISLFTSN